MLLLFSYYLVITQLTAKGKKYELQRNKTLDEFSWNEP